jgi:hypothetical protein
MREQGEPHCQWVDALLSQPRYQHEVAERLAHLLAVEPYHAGVHEGLRERLLVAGDARLGRRHLVVRERQVAAAALHLEAHPEVLDSHRRALDVPARPAGPNGDSHAGSPGALRTPQQPVERVALAGSVGVAATLGEDRGHRLPLEGRSPTRTRGRQRPGSTGRRPARRWRPPPAAARPAR